MSASELNDFIALTNRVQAALKATTIEQAFETLRKAALPTSYSPLKSRIALSASGGNSGSTNVIYNCVVPGTFAMTFDDGPVGGGAQLAEYFTSQNSLTTFFVNGLNYGCIYDRADDLKARFAAGHLIGAHTWGHDDVTKLNSQQLNNQITLIETALWKILGIRPRFFRPPYGAYNAAAIAIFAARGYQTVVWDYASGDASGASVASSLAGYSNLAPYPAPHNVLNHETYQTTVNQVVPVVVPNLLKQGYKLVTIAQCLNQDPYQFIGTPGTRDATWTCAGTPGPGVAKREIHSRRTAH